MGSICTKNKETVPTSHNISTIKNYSNIIYPDSNSEDYIEDSPKEEESKQND